MAKSGNPLVIAHHLMWTLYGWWLPNDPRGSTSRSIRSDLVGELGALHLGRKAIQPAGGDLHDFYEQAASVLTHSLLSFAPNEFAAVAEAMGKSVVECGYTCYACAIMPDHVHLVIRKHRDPAEVMINRIQALTRERLISQGLREGPHPVWTRGGWKVFLDHPDAVLRTVRYIEDNPMKMGLPRQAWGFTSVYDNWPLHRGHSPNSPYARALRQAGRYPR
jgi:REP element-mobilizing transposase RayT